MKEKEERGGREATEYPGSDKKETSKQEKQVSFESHCNAQWGLVAFAHEIVRAQRGWYI